MVITGVPMKTLVLGMVLLMGCAPLLEKLHGDDKPKPPSGTMGEIEDSIMLAEGRLYFDVTSDFDSPWTFTLDGPNGMHETLDVGRTSASWKPEWPAGTYTLRFAAAGAERAHRQFVVKMMPGGDDTPEPYVVRHGLPPVTYTWGQEEAVHTTVLVDVTDPFSQARFVWIKGNKVLDARDDSVHISSITSNGPFAAMRFFWGRVPKDEVKDYVGANLYLFLNDDLIGAWGFPEAVMTRHHTVLPEIAPDAQQVSLARAMLAKTYAHHDDSMTLEEPVACAAAASPKVRAALRSFEVGGAEQSMAQDRLAERNAISNDPRRSAEERAQARSEAQGALDDIGEHAANQVMDMRHVRAAARKYKKGCLISLGVPRYRAKS